MFGVFGALNLALSTKINCSKYSLLIDFHKDSMVFSIIGPGATGRTAELPNDTEKCATRIDFAKFTNA
jgi:hypothetical protein